MTVADSDCAWGYLDAMKGPLESGMALVSSNWGGPNIDMSWLDGETGCGGNCSGQPSFTVSHVKYNLPREKNFPEHVESQQAPENKIYTGNFEHQTEPKVFTGNLVEQAPHQQPAPENKIYTGNLEHQTEPKVYTGNLIEEKL